MTLKYIKVLHAKEPTFIPPRELVFDLDAFHHVADVVAHDLEQAFALTNTIDKDWWTNTCVDFRGCHIHGLNGARSSSVGDVFMVDGDYWMVDSVGFRSVILSPPSGGRVAKGAAGGVA